MSYVSLNYHKTPFEKIWHHATLDLRKSVMAGVWPQNCVPFCHCCAPLLYPQNAWRNCPLVWDHERHLHGVPPWSWRFCLLVLAINSAVRWLLSPCRKRFQQFDIIPRWWFQRFFVFTPLPAKMIQFDKHMFSKGLVQAATRQHVLHHWSMNHISSYHPHHENSPICFIKSDPPADRSLVIHQGDPETLGFTTVDFLSLTPGKWHLLKVLRCWLEMVVFGFLPHHFFGGVYPWWPKFHKLKDHLFCQNIVNICMMYGNLVTPKKNQSEISRGFETSIRILFYSKLFCQGDGMEGQVLEPTFGQSCLGYVGVAFISSWWHLKA